MFEKRFSVGLNLSEDMERLSKFFEHYKKYLNTLAENFIKNVGE